MEFSHIPVCYHPTTVMVVDDNQNYLESLKLVLNQERYLLKTYDNPKEVIHFLNEQYQAQPFSKGCIHAPEEDLRDHRQIEVDFKCIADVVYSPQRFTNVSTLVVDFAMPACNGLEVCAAIQDPNIYKVLLTGEADETIATRAFNEGLIQKFIKKDTPDLQEQLDKTILEFQYHYFYKQSKLILEILLSNSDHPSSCLVEPEFIKLFNQTIKSHNINEFYLLDASGSFLLMDFNGKISFLIVRNDDDMRAAAELAEFAETEVPEIVLQDTAQFKKLLFTGKKNDFNTDPASWGPFLYPATRVTRQSDSYYAYVDKPMHQMQNKERIVPLESYEK